MTTTEPQKEIKRPDLEGQINTLNDEPKAPEILKPQEDVHARVGEVIYPKENVPTLSSVRTELDAFKAQQQRVTNAIDRDPTILEKAGAALDHRKVAKSLAAVSVAENENLLTEIKAASVEDQKKLSEFNQKRVEGYAGAIGNASKSILTSVGHGSSEVLKALGGVALEAIKGAGKAAYFLGKKAVELVWAAWYASWDAYYKYRKTHPKEQSNN